jgi:hypothetical protein
VARLPPELILDPAEVCGQWISSPRREFVPFWTDETLRIAQRPHEQWGAINTELVVWRRS